MTRNPATCFVTLDNKTATPLRTNPLKPFQRKQYSFYRYSFSRRRKTMMCGLYRCRCRMNIKEKLPMTPWYEPMRLVVKCKNRRVSAENALPIRDPEQKPQSVKRPEHQRGVRNAVDIFPFGVKKTSPTKTKRYRVIFISCRALSIVERKPCQQRQGLVPMGNAKGEGMSEKDFFLYR
jgi:hypothetical protein